MEGESRSIFPAEIKRKAQGAFRNNNTILDECALINTNRIFYLSLFVIPSRILHIYLFSRDTTAASDVWRQGIIVSHLAVLAFFVVVFVFALRLKNKTEANTAMHALQYIVPIVTMTSGIVIVTIDQLVTTNITPFLLVSIAVGVIFLIRPWISAGVYLISYLSYYFLIALTITDPQILLSNRVNGTTAVCIGFLISLMVWKYNYVNITQKRQIEVQQEKLKYMAYYDQLTNLYNRHFFNKMIEKEFSSVERYGHETVIMLMDIDDFKDINDTYGHMVGDQVLKQLAQLVTQNVRGSDTVARFGGEEFIILAPNITLEKGIAFAEKLRGIIAENAFTVNSIALYITASFGVSLLQPTKKLGLENYYSLADDALYLAKGKGKNRVEKAS